MCPAVKMFVLGPSDAIRHSKDQWRN